MILLTITISVTNDVINYSHNENNMLQKIKKVQFRQARDWKRAVWLLPYVTLCVPMILDLWINPVVVSHFMRSILLSLIVAN